MERCGSSYELFLRESDLLPVRGPFVYVDSPSSFRTAYYSDFYNEPVKLRILRLVFRGIEVDVGLYPRTLSEF